MYSLNIFRKLDNVLDKLDDPGDKWDWKLENIWSNFFTDFDTVFGDTKHIEEDGSLIYEIEVPGFNKDNLSIEVSDNVLTIQGDREDYSNVKAGKKTIHKRLAISNVEDVSAEAKDGILYITLKPIKEVENGGSTKIEIK